MSVLWQYPGRQNNYFRSGPNFEEELGASEICAKQPLRKVREGCRRGWNCLWHTRCQAKCSFGKRWKGIGHANFTKVKDPAR